MSPEQNHQNKRRSLLHIAPLLTGRILLTLFVAAALFGMLTSVWAAGGGTDQLGFSASPDGSGFRTPTNTATRTPTVCGPGYRIVQSTGTVITGTTDIGNHCDDCTTAVPLPFPVYFYGTPYTIAIASSNGNLQFTGNANTWGTACPLPDVHLLASIIPYQEDLSTIGTICPGGCGIYSAVRGAAPNRQFILDYRATYYQRKGSARFDIIFYENSRIITTIYGPSVDDGLQEESGVQQSSTGPATQFSCLTATLTSGLRVDYAPTACGTPTPVVTPTPCPIHFSDVQSTDYFYEAVRYLYCIGAISGYADGTFRPYNNTTRGQLSKIIVLAEGWTLYTPPSPTFSDVPATDAFYTYIETAHSQGIISGYADNTFRPGNNVTRGQLSKIIVLAQSWAIYTPPAPTFSDVPATDSFYSFIETAFYHSIISGYADNTFRPGNSATRGQISKIVYLAITAAPRR
jgi:hypothetical protein